jgi:hypothetical protein
MPQFVLNRTFVLAGKGHMIRFEKGVPTHVPPELAREAVGIGAECLDGPVAMPGIDDEVAETVMTPADKDAAFLKAIAKLVARNDREDFEGNGKPSMTVLKDIVGFSFSKKERDAQFQKYRDSVAEAE